MKNLKFIVISLFVIIASCSKDEVSVKKEDFNSPEEFIENPSVKAAVKDSHIPIYEGENPPPLAGTYYTNGKITDASSVISELVGREVNSVVILYHQTASGKIDFQEKAGGITVMASGGYITGENGRFTIWQESIQSGSEAGLPDDITMTVAFLMSGTKLSDGDLNASGITIITKVETTNKNYDVDLLEGLWWMWKASFDLQTESKSAVIKSVQNNYFKNIMEDILREMIPQ